MENNWIKIFLSGLMICAYDLDMLYFKIVMFEVNPFDYRESICID